jgi:hypothetical protein
VVHILVRGPFEPDGGIYLKNIEIDILENDLGEVELMECEINPCRQIMLLKYPIM